VYRSSRSGRAGAPLVSAASTRELISYPYCASRSARHLALYGQAVILSVSCPKNGDVPKSPLPPIGSAGAIGRHDLNLKINFASYRRCRRHPHHRDVRDGRPFPGKINIWPKTTSAALKPTQADRTDPVPGRSSGRRQAVARQVGMPPQLTSNEALNEPVWGQSTAALLCPEFCEATIEGERHQFYPYRM
jgi:hypothetical protein